MIQLIFDDDADDHDDDDDDGDEGGPQRAMRWMRKGGVCNADRKSRAAVARMVAWMQHHPRRWRHYRDRQGNSVGER